MKRFGFLFAVFILIFILSASFVLAEWTSNLEDGLIHAYQFSEDSGFTTLDSVRLNPKDGIFAGNTNFKPGINGNAINVSGGNNFVDIEGYDGEPIGQDNFSISFWVKLGPGCDGSTGFLPFYNSYINPGGWGISSNCVSNFAIQIGASYELGYWPAIDNNAWTHLVLTRSEKNIRFYINGVMISDWDYRIYGAYAGGGIITPSPITFGAGINPGMNQAYRMLLDEVYIYNRSLKSNEVLELYNNGNGAFYSPNFSQTQPPEENETPNKHIVCQVYDDFSSGVLNSSKWEIRQDVEGQPFTDEYWVDSGLQNFHTQQNTIGDRRVYLAPKHNFTTGDILEYDFNVISKENSYMQMDLLIGDQYIRVGIMGYIGGVQGYDELGISHIKIEFQENNFHLERTTPSNVTLIGNLPLTNANGSYELYIGSVFTNPSHIDFDNFKLCAEVTELTLKERIGILESWKQIIEGWRISVIGALAILTSEISELTARIDNHENRIVALENNSITEDLTPNYWKYLSENERKNVVCGYAQDNNLTNIKDLGLNCVLMERTKGKREIVRCNCEVMD